FAGRFRFALPPDSKFEIHMSLGSARALACIFRRPRRNSCRWAARLARAPIGAREARALPGILPARSFIAPLREVHGLEMQLFAMQFRRLTVALKLPRKHRGMILIVAQRFAIGRLMFLAEMCSGRFVPLQRVNAH